TATATATFTATATATSTATIPPPPSPTSTPTPTPTPTPCANYLYTVLSGSIVPGTADTGNHTDDGSTAIALPFFYTLYDQTFTTCLANSDTSYEVQLYEGTSTFSIIFGAMGSATTTVGAVGVEKNGTVFTQYSCNTGGTTGQKITFTIDGCLTPTPTPTPTA